MMHETDEEFLKRVAAVANTTPESLRTALQEIDVEVWDLRRLASGDYTLCDGYCQGS